MRATLEITGILFRNEHFKNVLKVPLIPRKEETIPLDISIRKELFTVRLNKPVLYSGKSEEKDSVSMISDILWLRFRYFLRTTVIPISEALDYRNTHFRGLGLL